jgi:hypothetical protein
VIYKRTIYDKVSRARREHLKLIERKYLQNPVSVLKDKVIVPTMTE